MIAVGGITGCAGYRVGNISGKEIQGVRTVYVPTVRNASTEPSLQIVTTNAIIRRIENDGTLETSGTTGADSELSVTIKRVVKTPVRGLRNDGQFTAQFEIAIEAEATFINRRLGKTLFTNRMVSGKTSYFTQSDQTESERQALPMASEDLANNLVSLITEGW
jgi:Lipopolysaccharide-assembly